MDNSVKVMVYSMHPLERKVLPLCTSSKVSEILASSNVDEQELMSGILMLEKRGLVEVKKSEELLLVLEDVAKPFVSSDLPEYLVLTELLSGPKKMSQIKSVSKEVLSGVLGVLKRMQAVDIKKEDELILSAKDNAKQLLSKKVNTLSQFSQGISKIKATPVQLKDFEELKLRKFAKEDLKKTSSIHLSTLGNTVFKALSTTYKNLDLLEVVDSQMLKSGSWNGKEFRHYDVKIEVPHNDIGRRHPMMEANNILKEVFVEMGFKEMEGPLVEAAFWNMDVMWIPQDHPARDEQDTFYLDGKAQIPVKLAKKVKQLHEQGLKRTHTTVGDWSEEIASRRLLRTHSTATTFRTLAELGEKFKKGEDINGKYFYVAHVFRNEAVDATHLAEFFQGEGFIIGDNLSLADLMGFIKEYYAKLGITQIMFKPTFNPYTEPSMEAHYYDEKLKKWYALINSGVFRPETLAPFGLEKKRIIAWGMGASRVAALLSGKESMRDITGITCDFEWLKHRPLMKREIVRKG